MSDTFNYIAGPLDSLTDYTDCIEGIGQYLDQIKKEEGAFFDTQTDYDNRVKATLASGLMETNVLLLDIARSLRVLAGRDN